MTLAHPWMLGLLPLLIALAFLWGRSRRRIERGLSFPAPPALPRVAGRRAHLARWLPALRLLALAILVVALAGPRLGRARVVSHSEGVDIVLAIDISGSMRALDFPPGDRLEAAKEVARRFIAGRRGDRIGLVVFASSAYTQCPLTSDQGVLLELLDGIRIGDIADGTAIGMAVGTALNRLKAVPGESRVIILLTDGMNNTGALDPLTAAELARSLGVRIYTIGAGTRGTAPYPFDDPVFGRRIRQVEVDLDEETLRRIADVTGGLYFRATDAESLARIYERIDELEKRTVESSEYVEFRDVGAGFLWPALLLLLAELGLRATWLRRLP
ncbi:MAG: VWA domain-containing protein [Candidatus Eisenbacteria bacterium]|uniref:VWA domain-containing protein n=1 Tax=Eiseniibacteriota bacterium TaxID=2212470 RepID=A0A937X7I1_UNCEI|nr:VWA domain-containing protein [Candidatus Eisenbacteria bacterium]